MAPRDTNVHIEQGGKYPELRVYLEAVLSGDKLDTAEETLNSYTMFLSLRTHGSGDPSVYQEIEKHTEDVFNQVAGCVPVGSEVEFFNLLIKLASRTHSYAYNPFLIARTYVALASHAFENFSANKGLVKREVLDLRYSLAKLDEIATHFKGLKAESLVDGVKAFGAISEMKFPGTGFYSVAHPCVQAIDSLIRIPDAGSGESWTDQALPFWKNLKFYAPMSRTKMLASGQLSRLMQLR